MPIIQKARAKKELKSLGLNKDKIGKGASKSLRPLTEEVKGLIR